LADKVSVINAVIKEFMPGFGGDTSGSDHVRQFLVLSRLRSGLSTHLCSLSFEGQGAFAT
jgi:hypothetical protein